MSGAEPVEDTLTATAERIRTQQVSPVEVTRHHLDRIEALDSSLHAYITVLAERAQAQAAAAEREIAAGSYRGPLHGIPIALKDLCFTKGIRTTCGSALFSDWLPEEDATVAERLDTAGAVLLGKLAMTEFALTTHHPSLRTPVNPWDATRWPGISSSGSGVAVAAGLCLGALGTDTGGSIRFPAACNGIVGLKPTYGRVSLRGIFPLGASFDHPGPLALSVADAATLLQVMAGFDPRDPASRRDPVPDYMASLHGGVKGLRIGVDEAYVTNGVEPEVTAAVLKAVRVLGELGAEVVEVMMPRATGTEAMVPSEAAAAHEETFPSRADEYGKAFRKFLERGARFSGQDYAKAHATRVAFCGHLAGVFEEVDILACPAMTSQAPPLTVFDDEGWPSDGRSLARFTTPFNLSGSPTLNLPCGVSSDGLPLSLQLVGRHLDEALLCQAGHAYQQAAEWHKLRPPVV